MTVVKDICHRICVPNKTKKVNLNAFSLTTRTNESTILIKHISYQCEFISDGKNITMNVYVSAKCKTNCVQKRLY